MTFLEILAYIFLFLFPIAVGYAVLRVWEAGEREAAVWIFVLWLGYLWGRSVIG